MKLFTTLSTAALILAGIAAEVQASPYVDMPAFETTDGISVDDGSWDEARRGRGRGRGGDRDRSADDDDDDDNRSGSGRSRPRIPGGSGCDDPGDLLEHPECGELIDADGNGIDDRLENGDGTTGEPSGSGRRRPRVPGGSGCDDPEDLIEHPECSA